MVIDFPIHTGNSLNIWYSLSTTKDKNCKSNIFGRNNILTENFNKAWEKNILNLQCDMKIQYAIDIYISIYNKNVYHHLQENLTNFKSSFCYFETSIFSLMFKHTYTHTHTKYTHTMQN